MLLVPLFLLGPLGVLAFGKLNLNTHWSHADVASGGLAPKPLDEPAALVQVYGARAYNWRGAFSIHTWIATKRPGAKHYRVYQVIGWNLYRGRSAVSISRVERPDFSWFNARPKLLVERRGHGIDTLIDRIEATVRAYPYPDKFGYGPVPTATVSPPTLRVKFPSWVSTCHPQRSARTV